MALLDADDRTVDQFCTEVQSTRMYTAEEERALFKRYRTCKQCRRVYPPEEIAAKCAKCQAPRDLRARELIVESVLRFVVKEARAYVRKVRGRNVSDPELLKSLISAGTLGVMVAVDKFDLAAKTRFLTYAPWWIRAKILDELDHTVVVHVPAYRQKAHRAEMKYSNRTELEPHLITVSDLTYVDQQCSDTRTEETVQSNHTLSTLHRAFEETETSRRDRYIVYAYYGIREPPKSLHQIAETMDLSWESVRQIKERTLALVREHVQRNNVVSPTPD